MTEYKPNYVTAPMVHGSHSIPRVEIAYAQRLAADLRDKSRDGIGSDLATEAANLITEMVEEVSRRRQLQEHLSKDYMELREKMAELRARYEGK